MDLDIQLLRVSEAAFYCKQVDEKANHICVWMICVKDNLLL